jgi:hypothetical protein
MKTTLTPLALAAALAGATPALAQQKADDHAAHHGATPATSDMTEGEVRKVDKDAGKFTLMAMMGGMGPGGAGAPAGSPADIAAPADDGKAHGDDAVDDADDDGPHAGPAAGLQVMRTAPCGPFP